MLSRSAASAALQADEVRTRTALAQADLLLAASREPRNAYIPYNLGCLQAQTNATKAAIESFTRAIELDPRLPEAYYNRALLYARTGENEKAVADFSQAGQLGLYRAYAQIKRLKE